MLCIYYTIICDLYVTYLINSVLVTKVKEPGTIYSPPLPRISLCVCVWTVGANTKAHATLMKNRPQDALQTLKPGLAGD